MLFSPRRQLRVRCVCVSAVQDNLERLLERLKLRLAIQDDLERLLERIEVRNREIVYYPVTGCGVLLFFVVVVVGCRGFVFSLCTAPLATGLLSRR